MFKIVLFKEMKCLVRDKRSFVMALLIPLLIMPLTINIMLNALDETHMLEGAEQKITLEDDGPGELRGFLADNGFTVADAGGYEQSLKDGKTYAHVAVSGDKINIIFTSANIRSQVAAANLQSLLEAYKKDMVIQELALLNISGSILDPFTLGLTDINANQLLVLNLMLPIMLLTYCWMGISGTASDVCTGEKERGTLEPLIATSARAADIVLGKYFTAAIMGIATGLCSITGIFILSLVSGGGYQFTPYTFLFLLCLIVLISLLFSGIALCIGFFSKTIRENSTLTGLVSIVTMIGSYATIGIDTGNIPAGYFYVPFLNIICAAKELSIGIISMSHIFITGAVSLVCILISIKAALIIFGKEEIIFK